MPLLQFNFHISVHKNAVLSENTDYKLCLWRRLVLTFDAKDFYLWRRWSLWVTSLNLLYLSLKPCKMKYPELGDVCVKEFGTKVKNSQNHFHWKLKLECKNENSGFSAVWCTIISSYNQILIVWTILDSADAMNICFS